MNFTRSTGTFESFTQFNKAHRIILSAWIESSWSIEILTRTSKNTTQNLLIEGKYLRFLNLAHWQFWRLVHSSYGFAEQPGAVSPDENWL